MTDEAFWRLIEASRDQFDKRRVAGNLDRQAQRLKELLDALESAEIAEFLSIYRQHFRAAYRWDLWGAAYVIGQGCSDDGFADFRNWLISMGRDVFTRALADPESLVSVARARDVEDVFFEEFGYVADTILEERGENPLQGDEDLAEPEDPLGRKWTDDDLPRLFPRLWAAFGKA
ncbi:MAG TPA: DUF4240 domain-containing protein [Vicinamibacteria bacterium]|nr:DUF4240 domain-containing protein [Vicinamibacteria bacterium]